MYPQPYLDYLLYFHAYRDYFECHEVLEEHWINDRRKPIWAGLIRLAVAYYHHRRQNLRGALKVMRKAEIILGSEVMAVQKLGLSSPKLNKQIKERINALERGDLYRSVQLPIEDEALLQWCLAECHKRGLQWGKASDLTDQFLVNKHLLR